MCGFGVVIIVICMASTSGSVLLVEVGQLSVFACVMLSWVLLVDVLLLL